jgi:hypothetical protein
MFRNSVKLFVFVTEAQCILCAVGSLFLNTNDKPEGKRPLGRPGRRWVGNIKMDLRERRTG